jgi:tetratricopeptide (TPR) repeat protein
MITYTEIGNQEARMGDLARRIGCLSAARKLYQMAFYDYRRGITHDPPETDFNRRWGLAEMQLKLGLLAKRCNSPLANDLLKEAIWDYRKAMGKCTRAKYANTLHENCGYAYYLLGKNAKALEQWNTLPKSHRKKLDYFIRKAEEKLTAPSLGARAR